MTIRCLHHIESQKRPGDREAMWGMVYCYAAELHLYELG